MKTEQLEKLDANLIGQREQDYLKSLTTRVLPNNPSEKGWTAEQIKKHFYQSSEVLLAYIKKVQNQLKDLFGENKENITDIENNIRSILEQINGDAELSILTLSQNFNILKTSFDTVEQIVNCWNENQDSVPSAEKDSAGNVIKDFYTAKTSFDSLVDAFSNVKVKFEAIVPNTASATNKLVDENQVALMVANLSGNSVGEFATHAEMLEKTQGKVYKKNDYATIRKDETHENKSMRYKYNSETSVFVPDVELSIDGFTESESAALGSGITSGLVSQFQGYATGKQNALNETQMKAVNSGIDNVKTAQIETNKTDIANIKNTIELNKATLTKQGTAYKLDFAIQDANDKTKRGNIIVYQKDQVDAMLKEMRELILSRTTLALNSNVPLTSISSAQNGLFILTDGTELEINSLTPIEYDNSDNSNTWVDSINSLHTGDLFVVKEGDTNSFYVLSDEDTKEYILLVENDKVLFNDKVYLFNGSELTATGANGGSYVYYKNGSIVEALVKLDEDNKLPLFTYGNKLYKWHNGALTEYVDAELDGITGCATAQDIANKLDKLLNLIQFKKQSETDYRPIANLLLELQTNGNLKIEVDDGIPEPTNNNNGGN